MKIRIDYVSNSSSSSFMVVGAVFTPDEIVEMAKRHKVKSEHQPEDSDYDDWETTYELTDALKKKFPDLSFQRGFENFGDNFCIGIEYNRMKNNETKKDFEKRIKKQLKELTGKNNKVECLIDGGSDY